LRPRLASLVAVVLVLGFLASCGVKARTTGVASGGDINGAKIDDTTSTTVAKTLEPPVELPVKGDDGNALNLTATTAIADLQEWWKTEYPILRPGETYTPLTGGLYAYDSQTDPQTIPCPVETIKQAMFNAYYCPPSDAVAWDQEELMPQLADSFGEFTVAVVLAHEWGHVIQSPGRADIDQASVVMELQADCFAGAWVAHVRNDNPTHFNVDTKSLDMALAGILSLRDQPGTSANDAGAHGSGFDRVSAFQDGYDDGVKECGTYTNQTVKPYTFTFCPDGSLNCEAAQTNGEMPFADQAGGTGTGIVSASFDALEAWWGDTYPELSGGKPWNPLEKPVAFEPGDPPTCNGAPVEGYRLFYCSPDRYVGYSEPELRQAYQANGDFAAAALLATQYGLAAEIELGDDVSGDPVTATLRGDCFAGAWGAALIPQPGEDSKYDLTLSPGDLDEGVRVLLSFRTDSDRERQGPGFDRVRAFRVGVTKGAKACPDVKKSNLD
jgi:predicted metalloprotease